MRWLRGFVVSAQAKRKLTHGWGQDRSGSHGWAQGRSGLGLRVPCYRSHKGDRSDKLFNRDRSAGCKSDLVGVVL